MDSISSKELSKKKIKGITLPDPYGKLLGEIELSAIMLIWGENGSGKSTFALGMANTMAGWGRVEYIPAEENFGKTLIERVNRLKATADDLHFTRYKTLAALKKWVQEKRPVTVFLDSISVLSANDKDVVQFASWCRENGIGFVMVSHANKDSSFKGNSMLAHETDINIEVLKEDGQACTRKNRYLGELRCVNVPFEAKAIGKPKVKSEKQGARSKKKKRKKQSKKAAKKQKSTEFESRMTRAEQLMQNA
jgi:predicted ATP-dependent serine protease